MMTTTQFGIIILLAFLAGAIGSILLYRLIDRANRRAADTERRLADLERRAEEAQAILENAQKRQRPYMSYSERESLEGVALLWVRELTEKKAEYEASKGRAETALALLGSVLNGEKK